MGGVVSGVVMAVMSAKAGAREIAAELAAHILIMPIAVAIVRAILSLAQTLNMKTTAEGIENNELAQTLAALGCTYGQGYVFSRPVSADDAFAKLPGVRSA